jgi:hypothetical protein
MSTVFDTNRERKSGDVKDFYGRQLHRRHRRTGADLRAALTGTASPDDAFVKSIAEAISIVTSEVVDPWADD